MSKFLLRDGSLISVNTQADQEDVFSYTSLDGSTIHALISTKAESRLLQKVPSTLLTVSQRMQLSSLIKQ